MRHTLTLLAALLLASLAGLAAVAAEKKAMPKEDVVDVPAIGPGLCVANVFQSNMVLQRDKPLNIWGWAEPGEEVTVVFAGQEVRARAAADRAWQVTLQPMPANRVPQTMTVKGKSTTLTLENILVGDVWILGGQSNMEFPISNVDDGELEIVSANFPQIRLLTMPVGKGLRVGPQLRAPARVERLVQAALSQGRLGHLFARNRHGVLRDRLHLRAADAHGQRRADRPDRRLDRRDHGRDVDARGRARKIDGAETQAMLKDWDDRIAAFDPQADLKKRVAAYENRMKNLQAKGQPIPADSQPPTDLRPGPWPTRTARAVVTPA